MSKEPTNRYFDEVAIGLGSGGVSRREALKWLGAALLGGALASTPKWPRQRRLTGAIGRPMARAV